MAAGSLSKFGRTFDSSMVKSMREEGLEPSTLSDQILNLARMPIPPLSRSDDSHLTPAPTIDAAPVTTSDYNDHEPNGVRDAERFA